MGENRPQKSGFDWSALIMALLFTLSVAVFALTCTDRLDWMFRPLYIFLRMAGIVGIIGIAAFYIGECLPRSLYDYRRFPFRLCAWEKDGRVYERLGIRWLKAHSIDMSSIMPRAFPKQHTMSRDPGHLRRLIQEMCNAELVHWILMLLSPVFFLLIEGWYGLAISLGYALSNLGDIMIQRYNRPRIIMILERIEACENC